MKKRRLPCFLLTFAMLLTVAFPAGDPVYAASDPANYIFDISAGSIIISPGTDPAATVRVAYGAGQVTEEFPNSQNITIIGTALDNQILVNGAAVNITLNNVSIKDYMGVYDCVFDMTSGSRVDLTLAAGSRNILASGERDAALRVPVGAVLTIHGTDGSLSATGGPGIGPDPGGAGIGGSRAEIYGVINILGGTITAKGGQYAAGIGGGYASSAGTANSGIINISGNAVVTATSGIESAGIGGGYLRPGGTINISGNARVTASGNYQGAGIGGCYAPAGTITISDTAFVTATGGNYGAGIGGGYSGSGGTITIKDNTIVSAAGGSNGAGIGGGYSGAGGLISISGGTLAVKGGQYAAGIGGGTGGAGGTVNISGLADVTVTGGATEGAGIGGGSNGAYDTVPAGAGAAITIDSPAVVKAAAVGTGQPAIHALGGVLNPAGTAQVLLANFTSSRTAGSNIRVFDKNTLSLTASFTPAAPFQSVAFTVPAAPVTYLLKSDGIRQQHSVSRSSDFEVPAPGMTLFALVEDVLFSGIEISVPAVKSVYIVGETLDITGMVVTGTYTDLSTDILPVTIANITGFNSTAATESQTLTISFGGKTTSYTVSVIKEDQTAPAGLGWIDESVKGRNDGSITNVTAAMEYKPSAAPDTAWTTVTGTVIANLSPGSYDVRKAAKIKYNASPSVTVAIEAGADNTYTLEVTAPVFAGIIYNDPIPAAKPILITDTGNTDAVISDVKVSSDSFSIGGSGSAVHYGTAISTWTIQPGADLAAGKHTGTITVTYNNGATALADVTLIVGNAAQSAPVGVGSTDESVNGRNDGMITGVSARMEYKPDTAADTAWTTAAGTTISDLAPGTYQIRYAAKSNYDASPVTLAIISGGIANTYTLTFTVPVFAGIIYGDEQPAAKAIGILSSGNTDTENLDVRVSGSSFTIAGSGATVPYGTRISTWTVQPKAGLAAGTYTEHISFTYDSTTMTSDVHFIVLNAEQSVPTGITCTGESVAGRNDGTITGVTAGMEYKLSSAADTEWKTGTGSPISRMIPGIYVIRAAAKTNYNAGDPFTATITAGAANTYTLNAASPVFADIIYGDAQPAAQVFAISNIGNTDASISKMSSDTDIFTLAGHGGTIPYGQTITTWTIQPRANLPVGMHTAVITITYNNGAAAAVPAGITVLPHIEVLAPQVAADAPWTILQGEVKDIIKTVLTEADNEKLAGGSHITICLKITKGNIPQTDKDLAAAALGSSTPAEFLDISLVKTVDGVETKITRTNSPLRITMEIPVEMRKTDRVFAVVRIHSGLAIVLTDLDTDPDTITFETDSFSTYVTAYKDAAAIPAKAAGLTAAAARTGEKSSIIPLNAVGTGALILALLINKKRRQQVTGNKKTG
ncbi:MAG: bacterial Ig-like domain-containing protein [Eubacteriales bacterium]